MNRKDTAIDRRAGNRPAEWGSDVIAETLRALDLRYLALNPGASYRGLHDSLVNHVEDNPHLLLCIHEEAAVAIAHGYAKVTGQPMGVVLHSNVGLMHATMGIYNAWCDRVPILVIGATGPVDAAQRRPWIDWIHTSQDQGALIRDFVKWDDQPGSIEAAQLSLLEAAARAGTAPCGPVYVNLDAALQERRLDDPLPELDAARYAPPPPPAPDPALLSAAAELLADAQRPVVLMGRLSRDTADWDRRIALVDRLAAKVVTDFKTGATFPSAHPANIGKPGYFLDAEAKVAIAAADVIVNLDGIDFGGALRAVFGPGPIAARIISATLDVHNHRGWVKDSGLPAPADIHFLNPPDRVAACLLERLGAGASAPVTPPPLPTPIEESPMTPQTIAVLLRRGLAGRKTCLVRAPLSWTGADWPVDHPLGALGSDGGGGVGSGPGMAVGSALALRDTHPDILPLAVLGDGDFLMNASAIWTAANQRVPLLVVVMNNRSFYNDEVHQESVAIHRGRPRENKTVGVAMEDPDIDIRRIAEGFGAAGYGRITTPAALGAALAEALAAVERGEVAVLDVEAAKGYAPSMAKTLRSG
ncbi:MAG: thiamine pyrophosphate-binding protein [Rhodoplanes sp.]